MMTAREFSRRRGLRFATARGSRGIVDPRDLRSDPDYAELRAERWGGQAR